MMRREVLERTGGYSNIPLCEDYELWLRAMRVTDLASLDEPLLHYRTHDGNISSSGRKEQAEMANELAIRAMSISLGVPVNRGPAMAVISPYRTTKPKDISDGAHFLYALYDNFIKWNKMNREEIMDIKWAASERMSHILMRAARIAPMRSLMVLWQTSRFGPGVDWRFALNVMDRGMEKVNGQEVDPGLCSWT